MLKLAAKMVDEVGCAAVVVAAKPGAIDFYAKYGFVPFEPLGGRSDARPRPTAKWLPIEAIKRASEAHRRIEYGRRCGADDADAASHQIRQWIVFIA